LYTLFRTERPKTISCPEAHPRIGHIREFPSGADSEARAKLKRKQVTVNSVE